jgi:AraC-like DNA-binding protein
LQGLLGEAMQTAAKNAVEWHNTNSLACWNKIVGDTFGSTTVLASNQDFAGHLDRGVVNDIQVIRIRAEASRVQKMAPKDRDDGGVMLVHLQSTGTSVNFQGSRSGRLAAGEAVLCDPNRSYAVEFESAYEMFVLKFPLARLAAHFPGLDPRQATVRRLETRRSRLLLAFLATAWDQMDCLEGDADWRDCVNQTVFDLVARAVDRSDDGPAVSDPSLRTAVLGHIRRHLNDPALRTSTIAQAMGVSGRSVQTVFEGMATTASAFILEERLRLAAERVRLRRQPITQIAMDLGFNDPAYFSRCFHRKFGCCPRDYSRR